MIVDRYVHPFPSRSRATPSLTGDAMSGAPFDAAQSLGVEVKHVAGRGMFIPMNRRWWIELAEPAQSRSSAHASNCRNTPTDLFRDLADRHPLTTQLNDPAALFVRDLPGLVYRLRTAVQQRLVRSGTSPPFPCPPHAHPRRLGRCAQRPSLRLHSCHQQCSTREHTSRILLHVHA